MSSPTADDMGAKTLDYYELLGSNKLLVGKELLRFGITHNNQHPKGSMLIVDSPPSPASPISLDPCHLYASCSHGAEAH